MKLCQNCGTKDLPEVRGKSNDFYSSVSILLKRVIFCAKVLYLLLNRVFILAQRSAEIKQLDATSSITSFIPFSFAVTIINDVNAF